MADSSILHDDSAHRNGQPHVDEFDPAKLAQTDAADQAPDPFNAESLRVAQGFNLAAGVKKAIIQVQARKPDKSWWVQAHPDPAYRMPTTVIELKEEREVYLVAPHLRPDLVGEPTFKFKMLVTAINRQGVLFLWEANLPRPDGKADEWSRTSIEAINMATKGWVRVVANMSLGGYEVYTATGDLPPWRSAGPPTSTRPSSTGGARRNGRRWGWRRWSG